MEDLRSQVPSCAFINAQIIQKAHTDGALESATRYVEKLHNFPPSSLSIHNAAYSISLLYCLVLIPKELWLKNKGARIFKEIGDPSTFAQITVIDKYSDKDFDAYPAYYFIKHLRNALAHVRFSLTVGPDFTFWDQKSEHSPRIFEATMSKSNLEQFLSTVGVMLANLWNRPDSAQG